MTSQGIIGQRLAQTEYNTDELDAVGRGEFFYPDSPRLPARWWRAFDSISDIVRGDGGGLTAHWEVQPDLPLFEMHFPDQPVLPGVFGLDQVQMLTGALLSSMGYRGMGLAKGGGPYRFQNMITPESKEVIYQVSNAHIFETKVRAKITADGKWLVDGQPAGMVERMEIQVVFPRG